MLLYKCKMSSVGSIGAQRRKGKLAGVGMVSENLAKEEGYKHGE